MKVRHEGTTFSYAIPTLHAHLQSEAALEV